MFSAFRTQELVEQGHAGNLVGHLLEKGTPHPSAIVDPSLKQESQWGGGQVNSSGGPA